MAKKKTTEPAGGAPIKLTWWKKKGVWLKVIGKVAHAYEEGDHIGEWELVETQPKKWYLGPDRAEAEIAARRLTQLWQDLQAQGLQTWNENELYLRAAKAICAGDYQVVVDGGLIEQFDPTSYTAYIDQLNQQHRCIHFVPADTDLFTRGQAGFATISEMHVKEAKRTAAIAGVSPKVASTRTLHQALDSFAEHLRKTYVERGQDGSHRTTEWGHRIADTVERLKASAADMPLSEFGFDAITAMTNFWKFRPNRKGSTKPIKIETVKQHVKALRRFIDWLDSTDLFDWREPRKVKKATAVRWQDLQSEVEISEKARGLSVRVWSIEELDVIYRYTTQWERLLLLLGLNCAFANAEVQSLRLSEIDLEKQEIIRIRRKKRVFGRFKLWPETVALLHWAVEHRQEQIIDAAGNDISPTPESYALLTENGQPLYRLTETGKRSDSIANAWNRLIKRVQTDNPNFRKLSFKHLRKTAGDLVRRVSDGEIAGVFLCHADAVRSDAQADVYTNRPFDKVFDALDRVHEMLHPMLSQRPQGPLDSQTKGTGPNVSRKLIDDIRTLASRGVPTATIARLVHVSEDTVRRWSAKGTSKVAVGRPSAPRNEVAVTRS